MGKSHLENELAQNHSFYQLTKYTDRPYRPGESKATGLVAVSPDKYTSMQDSFFFTLEYKQHRYGWLRKELVEAVETKNIVVAVTIESLLRLLQQDPEFIAIILTIKLERLELLKKRMLDRLGYVAVDDTVKRAAIEQDVAVRLEMASKEISELEANKHKYPGVEFFYIEDDDTLYSQVIPYIQQLCQK